MLDQVDFPLTSAQVSDFILNKEYTSFLTLQQAISELDEAGLVATRSIGNRTHLLITGEYPFLFRKPHQPYDQKRNRTILKRKRNVSPG